ncbi:type III PLP-dependent enzyme [Nocardia puris]|uniref:Ornithine decarboxylase n=1 Tax=Nocardia puris TaxID=208602 RepID=A0A366E2B8_9NOCA|nr:type III PLP-dependent enzyme [Nocardia puris]MBF6212717.1 type III PLP-dependent enzyme [Nocardia puris]MBF6367654.1 type III PLP-dependent enzyme [Nocardia puris]MBF6461306.1 type III PLP-dependent enzyme [Nocardia puris]RBO96462.1 ornithine decarboxylase [Nocardia puris]
MPESPYLVIHPDRVRENFRALDAAVRARGARSRLRYAVKASPVPELITLLDAEGAEFDVASIGEIDLCLGLGVAASKLCYGNPIKKAADIARAHAAGVRRFAFDTEDDLERIAELAPGAEVECRFLASAPQSRTPFGAKFGCTPAEALRLLVRARDLGLAVAGPYFHVGSQQLDPEAWRIGIRQAGAIADALADKDIRVTSVNIGGGLPISYADAAPALSEIAAVVNAAAAEFLPETADLVIEPGRALVGNAGTIHAEVVGVRHAPDGRRWVYLDIGRYNGMAETENEYIAYRFVTDRDGDPVDEAVIAGPTCDGDDVLYQRTRVLLPTTLRAGDRLQILDTGAYTASYSSVSFNGFPPLTVHVSGAERE